MGKVIGRGAWDVPEEPKETPEDRIPETMQALLRYSLQAVGYSWDGLTQAERYLVSREDFDALSRCLREVVSCPECKKETLQADIDQMDEPRCPHCGAE